MAQPPATNLPHRSAPQRDALVATKLHVPRAGFLPRPRLVARLASGMARGLTVVCTPAGFGKTSLLGDWARRRQQPVAWLSLDGGDSDPARFWRYVAAALDGPRPGVGQRVDALFQGAQPPLEAVLTVLINELVEGPGEAVLVLDDYHLVEAPSVHGSLAVLLERLPPQLRLVLASRADPPLPLARLRARGQLAELHAADLRFTLEETAAFLREAAGVDLSLASVAALLDRTEGWAAGVQLAALSLQGHADPAGFVAAFSGSHRYVLDYLTEEVLARQPVQVVRFLLETSVLERLSGPLCDAVTGGSDGQAMLEHLERANLFLVPLDDVRGWWRYHHLFADLLRARLRCERPERVPELHHAAAVWHAEHGFADDAVRHALAAGEVDWAARLVERHVEALLRRSEGATLHRWLAALPAEPVRSRPRLYVAQAVSAVLAGHVEAVEPLVTAAEDAFAATGDEPHEPSVGRARSGLANVPAVITFLRAELARLRGDPEQAVAYDQRTLARLGEVDWALRSQVAWNLAVADWLRGRLDRAEQALADLVIERRAAGEDYLTMRACYDLGQVQQAQGRLGAALATYHQSLEEAGDADRQLPVAGMAHVGLAQVLYERDELAAAADHATRGVGLCRQLAFTQPLATGLALLARIRQAQGDRAGAREAIREAERVELSPQVVTLLNLVPVQAARLALGAGEVAEAARWVRQRGLGADHQPEYPRESEYLVVARTLLARREPERALGVLERLHAQAVAQGRTGSRIELRALHALGLDATGDRAAALAALAEALALACPEGYVRVFVDEGAPMASLLNRLAAAHRTGRAPLPGPVRPDDLDRLLQAFQPGVPRAGRPPEHDRAADSRSVELLTDRELEVLGLLAAGRSNPEIAEELVVVLDTVKKHVGHILDKLGAANRTQAVARARALGLLR